jgi:hypothetical protein
MSLWLGEHSVSFTHVVEEEKRMTGSQAGYRSKKRVGKTRTRNSLLIGTSSPLFEFTNSPQIESVSTQVGINQLHV